MSQAWVSIALLVLILALIPLILKWFQQRYGLGVRGSASSSRIVSVLPLGPQQRVVTVEVGAPGQQTWLTLGVTPQSITCLHVGPAPTQEVQTTETVLSGSTSLP